MQKTKIHMLHKSNKIKKGSVVNCSKMAIMAAKTNANNSNVVSIATYCYYLGTLDILKIVSSNKYLTYAFAGREFYNI